MIMMEYLFLNIIVHPKETVFLLDLTKTPFTNIIIRLHFTFEPLQSQLNKTPTFITIQQIKPFIIYFSQLVAQTEPTRPQVMVPSKYFDLLRPWQHSFYNLVNNVRLLALFPDITEYHVT